MVHFTQDVLVVCLVIVLFKIVRDKRRRPLPPGPPGLPLIGNALDIPQDQAWLSYRDLWKRYGDVVALHAFGKTIIVVSSMSAAVDLFEKRSAIYSDRTASVLAEMTGWTWNLAFKRYGDDWRNVRRLLWRHFQPSAVAKFQPAQQREARRFLKLLLEDQSDVDRLIKLSLSATILTSVHGLPSEDVTYHYVDILNQSEEGIAEIFTPGAFMVEFLPWLRRVPAWFPGAGWKRRLPGWQAEADAIREEPYEAAKNAGERGQAKQSMLGEILETEKAPEDEKTIKETTAVAFGAGTDTTAATIFAFFCAILLHPDVQAHAQAELDAVVGPDRLPQHADRPALPYIFAIVKEILRWHTVAPLGVAHRCMEEDEYRGWRIPEGAIVMPNAWALLHDPEAFPEPEVFRPERWLKDEQLDPDAVDPGSIAFGFGRRICPGRHFADDALFIYIASVLHVFDIQAALDPRGQPIPVEVKMTSGFLSYVERFEHSIRLRSEAAEALIRGDL
ncbi:O-methylsterigmatocystin oxidoreductase [Trametes meyenii]|nr:O-methylsterigmatocystin oxidoreductase [Trametes meyenii]